MKQHTITIKTDGWVILDKGLLIEGKRKNFEKIMLGYIDDNVGIIDERKNKNIEAEEPSTCKDCGSEVTPIQEKNEQKYGSGLIYPPVYENMILSKCCDAPITDDGFCSDCKDNC